MVYVPSPWSTILNVSQAWICVWVMRRGTPLAMQGLSGVEVTRALRNDQDPHLRRLPVVLITAQAGVENTSVGFAAGVTDYLTKPFRPAHVRSRVRAWLLRGGAAV